MELCLGTVQFGMKYGIHGKEPPALEECIKCIDFATQNGITSLDTAEAYGNAEEIIGYFIAKKKIQRNCLQINTKLKPHSLDKISSEKYYETIKNNLVLSLKKLNTDYVDSFMFHTSSYVFNDEMIYALKRIKTEGFTNKIGISLYYTDELRACSKQPIDVIQFPFSIFDQRLLNEKSLIKILENNTEINTRSALLQGVLLTEPEKIPNNLSQSKPFIESLNYKCQCAGLNVLDVIIGFVKKEKSITKLVFGVHDINQLKGIINAFNCDIVTKEIVQISKEYAAMNKSIIIPSLWNTAE